MQQYGPSGFGQGGYPGGGGYPVAPQAHGAPMGAATGPGYEFTAQQNQKISSLAGRLIFAGVMQMVFGGAQLLGGWLLGLAGWFVGLPGALALIVIGGLFCAAGMSFKDIVRTQGNDVEHLMSALGKLSVAALVQIIAYVLAILLGILTAVVILFFFAAAFALS